MMPMMGETTLQVVQMDNARALADIWLVSLLLASIYGMNELG